MTIHFNINRDNELTAAGSHFWCHACLMAHSLTEQSPDTRYCLGCYNILKNEAETIMAAGNSHRPGWIPVGTATAPPKRRVNETEKKQPVLKLPLKDKVQNSVSKLPEKEGTSALKHAGGRPRKLDGKLSRSTLWRRGKEAQGLLL